MGISRINIGKENRYAGGKRYTTSQIFIDANGQEYTFQSLSLNDLVEIHHIVAQLISIEENQQQI